MHIYYCELPLQRIEIILPTASNQPQFGFTHQHPSYFHACTGNVRLMRRPKETDKTCFALSGKLADVCATLDKLAAEETRNAYRFAVAQ